jgi:hypothetical protein
MPLGGEVQIISGVVHTPPHPPENPCLNLNLACEWLFVKTCQTGLENIKFLYTI